MIDLFFNFVSFNGYFSTWVECFSFWFLVWLFFHIPIKIYVHFIKGRKKE